MGLVGDGKGWVWWWKGGGGCLIDGGGWKFCFCCGG